MTESNFSTEQAAQPKPRSSAPPRGQGQVDINQIDIITARHTRAFPVLSAITADLTSGESVLSTAVIAGSLWTVEALIEQARATANSM